MPETPSYQDPTRPVGERVADLMSRMTIEEKVGQMFQMDYRAGDAERNLRERHVGSILNAMGEQTNALQRAAEETRLGIPILFGIDAIHGHAFWPTGTVFPTQLGLSCSWNPALIEQVGRITAREVAHTGVQWTFSPVAEVARDLRWGRVDETFGEDPYLVGVLSAAMTRGYQGDDLADPHTILACAKHYTGYSGCLGGRDASEAELSRRALLATYLPSFRAAIEAGCATVMAGYQAIDGTPCSANRWLLWDVLKRDWGFEGIVVTDYNNVGRMHTEQMTCATMEEAVRLAVEAGNDMIMATPEFPAVAAQLVKNGALDIAHIDEAVRRILTLKFRLGLFDENRYADLESGPAVIGCAAHRQAALESACQSIVLLKNQDRLLPLRSDMKRIAVLGPNADDPVAQLGDWVSWNIRGDIDGSARPRESIVTVLDGIRRRAGPACRVDYARGCDVLDPSTQEVAAAAELARNADVAIVVVGDAVSQNGELRDRANLDLSGGQQRLLEAVYATGTPLVVVLINGKPLSIPWVAQHAHAILEAWNPGLEGGAAVAAILFGDCNPSGKLTISFPYHVGQQPVYYNQAPGWHGSPPKYVDMPAEPLFPFGYGLSYTTFAYSNLALEAETLASGKGLHVQVDVENTGARPGVEIVQLYIQDLYGSVTRPIKELKAFLRVDLKPGEKKRVRLETPYERLALVNRELARVVEPGEFVAMVGSSSRDQDLLKARFCVRG